MPEDVARNCPHPPSECCPCHAQPSLEKVPPGLPGEDSVVCLLTVRGYVSMWPPMCSSDQTGWVHMRRPRVELAAAAQSGPALWVMCPVPSCSFSVVAQHSSVGNGANRKGGSTGINTVLEMLSENLKTLLLFNFYGFFFSSVLNQQGMKMGGLPGAGSRRCHTVWVTFC